MGTKKAKACKENRKSRNRHFNQEGKSTKGKLFFDEDVKMQELNLILVFG